MVDISTSPTPALIPSAAETPLIKAVGLRKVFPPAKRGGEPFTAVDGIDFESAAARRSASWGPTAPASRRPCG